MVPQAWVLPRRFRTWEGAHRAWNSTASNKSLRRTSAQFLETSVNSLREELVECVSTGHGMGSLVAEVYIARERYSRVSAVLSPFFRVIQLTILNPSVVLAVYQTDFNVLFAFSMLLLAHIAAEGLPAHPELALLNRRDPAVPSSPLAPLLSTSCLLLIVAVRMSDSREVGGALCARPGRRQYFTASSASPSKETLPSLPPATESLEKSSCEASARGVVEGAVVKPTAAVS